MIERPIIMQAHLVKAILDGRKTQTRRMIKHQPSGSENFPANDFCNQWFFRDAYYACPGNDIGRYVDCPYGKTGDRLWVRETHAIVPATAYRASPGVEYRLSPDGYSWAVYRAGWERSQPGAWKPSIHLPRWASRLTLEVVSVRVEQVQSISDEDAEAEGIDALALCAAPMCDCSGRNCPRIVTAYADIWNNINGKRPGCSWSDNPFVWCIEFRRVEA
jgi:hypothetical protein